MKMVVRIALILVILACLGSLYCIHTVRIERNGLRIDKINLTESRTVTTNLLLRTEGTLRDTIATLNTTSNTLVKTIEELGATNKTLVATSEERDKLKTDLADATQKLQTTTTELASTKEALKKAEDTVATQAIEIAKIEEIKKQLADANAENKMLGEKLEASNTNVKRLVAENEDLRRTPVNCRGRVAGVDKRWNFLVLDIGQDQKVRKESAFIVYRDSKFICKAQIVAVSANSAVAEILPDMRRGTPRVGDIAIH